MTPAATIIDVIYTNLGRGCVSAASAFLVHTFITETSKYEHRINTFIFYPMY